MNKKLILIITGALFLTLVGCRAARNKSVKESTDDSREGTESSGQVSGDSSTGSIKYRFAGESEGKALMMANDRYYEGFSQNDLDYRMQKKDASMDEYLAFASDQVRDFTDEEKALIDDYFSKIEKTISDNGYVLPPLDEIVLIKTTMVEENGAGGYTHGTQIYVSGELLDRYFSDPDDEAAQQYLDYFFWHELFHCLTRSNHDFKKEMYQLIHFTVQDKDFPQPPVVKEYHISNPDVEHHDSSATFHINGEDVECFVDFVTTRHFEKEGDNFFEKGIPALVPVDGRDIYFSPEQADNFYEIFGKNTEYVIDPEECLADNFSYAMNFGKEGPDGKGYPTPEIIEGIIAYLSR